MKILKCVIVNCITSFTRQSFMFLSKTLTLILGRIIATLKLLAGDRYYISNICCLNLQVIMFRSSIMAGRNDLHVFVPM